MGSPLRLTIGRDAMDSGDAVESWALVVDEFAAAEAAMSRFRGDSELTRVNQAAGSGMPVRPSIRLRRALVAADRAHRISNGRFDPRILVDLDRLGYRGAPLGADATRPGRTRPADADAPVVRRVDRDRDPRRPTESISAASARAWPFAGRRRPPRSTVSRTLLLEAGGDLVALGVGPDGGPWRLGIEDPADAATSPCGDRRETGRRRDLVDPRPSLGRRTAGPSITCSTRRTGEPADRGLLRRHRRRPGPAWAEVWSKVLFLGVERRSRPRHARAAWGSRPGGSPTTGSLEMTAAAAGARTAWVAVRGASPTTLRFACARAPSRARPAVGIPSRAPAR